MSLAPRSSEHSLSRMAASALLHGVVLVAVLFFTRHATNGLRPLRLPGTPQGKHMLLSYSTGAPAASAAGVLVHTAAPRQTPSHVLPRPVPPAKAVPTPAPTAPAAETGTGRSGSSAFGDDNVRIALPQVHPRPEPDLSSLPHGAAGDVIVDVTIDDTGKVTATNLVRGLGAPIDTTVMQSLRDWHFTPASRNGQNIASEQEVLIHYERG